MLNEYPPQSRDELTRDQVTSVVAGRTTAPRVPVGIHLWVHQQTYVGAKQQYLRS